MGRHSKVVAYLATVVCFHARTYSTSQNQASHSPGLVGGRSIRFANVTHNSAVVFWERPALSVPVTGYRLRIRNVSPGGAVPASMLLAQDTQIVGSPCDCHILCWLELSSPEEQGPCIGTREQDWILLGYPQTSYGVCVEECCGAEHCGSVFSNEVHRFLQQDDGGAYFDRGCFENQNHYQESVVNNSRIISSNGVPAQNLSGNDSLTACEVQWCFTLPANPALADALTALPEVGVIGVAMDGVPFYSAGAVDGSNAVLDGAPCTGRPGEHGDWHYQQDYVGCASANSSSAEIQLGYALDGFPIYGPLDGSLVDVETALDPCNGRWTNEGYRYHARRRAQVNESSTSNADWSYILGCFSGTPSAARISRVCWDDEDVPSVSVQPAAGTTAPISPARGSQNLTQSTDMHGGWTNLETHNSATYYPLLSLRPDTLYYAQVQAYNGGGSGPWSGVSYALHTHAAPDRPTAMQVSSSAATSLVLHRSAPRTRGTSDCSQTDSKSISARSCTTWGGGSPIMEYVVAIAPVRSLEDRNVPRLLGCMDPSAFNYNPDANVDIGCIAKVIGCTDPLSFNYDPSLRANVELPDTCIAKVFGCMLPDATNYNPAANTPMHVGSEGSCFIQVEGCTDSNAMNWSPAANVDDGSCAQSNPWIWRQVALLGNQNTILDVDAAVTICSNFTNSPNASVPNGYTFAEQTGNDTTTALLCAVVSGGGLCKYVNRTRVNSSQLDATYAAFSCDASAVDFTVEVGLKSTSNNYTGLGSSRAFIINGENGATLRLTRGRTYYFRLAWQLDGHSFYFTESSSGSNGEPIEEGVQSSMIDEQWWSAAYTGLTGSGVLAFTPGYDLPDVIYYECYFHSHMGGRINLVFDLDAYPPPELFPPCIAPCWTVQAVSSPVYESSGSESMIEPFYYGMPSWSSFSSICNWLASVYWGCNAGTRTSLIFNSSVSVNGSFCEHLCVRGLQPTGIVDSNSSCSADTLAFWAQTVNQTCSFGCDGNAATGANVLDACGICGGDGQSCVGCMDSLAVNFSPDATIDAPQLCVRIAGCMDSFGLNFNPDATNHTGCTYPEIRRCSARATPAVYCTNFGLSTGLSVSQLQRYICADAEFVNYSTCVKLKSTLVLQVNSSGCPDHPYSQSASCVAALPHAYSFEIPQSPAVATGIRYPVTGEPVGIALNGVPIFSSTNMVLNHTTNMSSVEPSDLCQGAIDDSGRYGYHQVPLCLLALLESTTLASDYWDNLDICGCNETRLPNGTCGNDNPAFVVNSSYWPLTGDASPLLGWARDGFGIYGPYDENGALTKPYYLGGTLDLCGGRLGDDGRYQYHLTPASPTAIACYRGTPGAFFDWGVHGNSTCAPGGWTSTYTNVPPYMPSCNLECMPTCTSDCVEQWAHILRQFPFSGLLTNSWHHLPGATRIYRVRADRAQLLAGSLDSCTLYDVHLTDINAAGRSTRSPAVRVRTDCRPLQPEPPQRLKVTSSTITLQWSHAQTDSGSPIMSYRLFSAQRQQLALSTARNPGWRSMFAADEQMGKWTPVTGSNDDGDEQEAAKMFPRPHDSTTARRCLTRSPNPSWNLYSDTWSEVIFSTAATRDLWTPLAVQQFTVRYLEPGHDYKFRIVAVNAAGESFASFDSAVLSTPDAEITSLRLFAGLPCITSDSAKVPFHAISDGTNVQYAWKSGGGGTLGSCITNECSAMVHRFAARGTFQVVLYASNPRGVRLVAVTLAVRRCGCTDPLNSNYWFASEYTLPRSCRGYGWAGGKKELRSMEVSHFSIPLVDRTFAANIVVRVDIGEVDIYLSNSHIPATVHNLTFQRQMLGVQTFALLDMDYMFLYGNETLKNITKNAYIAIVGRGAYTRFDIYAKRTDFSRGPDGAAYRQNLDERHNGNVVKSGHYDFWELYVPKLGTRETTIDATVQVRIAYGCLTLYVSKYESFPSPMRAHGSQYGHHATASRHACAGSTPVTITVTLNFARRDPRRLYIGVWGSKVYRPGYPPPLNLYDIEGAFMVIAPTDTNVNSLTASSVYYNPFTNETISYGTVSAASSASDFDYISPGLYSSEGFTGEVPYMGWSFFTVACSELALTVTVHVNVSLGAVSLYERAAQSGFVALPSRGHHDYFVHDDDADGSIEFTINFNQVGPNGKVNVGLFGVGGGILQGTFDDASAESLVSTNHFTIYAAEDVAPDCTSYSYGQCEYIQTVFAGVPQMAIFNAGEYVYYEANIQSFMANDNTWNPLKLPFDATPRNHNLFNWLGPLSAAYIAENFGSRTANAELVIEMLPFSEASTSNPINCVLYASTDDPFPSHKRTYESWLDYTFDAVLRPDSDPEDQIMNFATLILPMFRFDALNVHFSVTCDGPLSAKVTVNFEQFHAGLATSVADEVQLRRLCPGQAHASEPPCNGHGVCIDEGVLDSTNGRERWTTSAATCNCYDSWVGYDCAVKSFPADSYLRILQPRNGEVAEALECAPCIDTSILSQGTVLDASEVNQSAAVLYARYSPFRGVYRYEDLTYSAERCGTQENVRCPPCGQRGVQVVYEIRTPAASADIDVLVFINGVPHEPTVAQGFRLGPIVGNSTQRVVAVNLPAGKYGARPIHSVQLILLFGPDRTPISDAYAEFVISADSRTCPSACALHGICHHGYCVCFDGYSGIACDIAGDSPGHHHNDAAEDFPAYSRQIEFQLQQEGAAQLAGSLFHSITSTNSLHSSNELLGQRDQDTVHRLSAAAAHNKREMQVFMAAWAEQRAEAAEKQELEMLGHGQASSNLDQYAQDILQLTHVQTKALQLQSNGFLQRKHDTITAIKLKKEQRRADWISRHRVGATHLQHIARRNGPLN